VLKKRKNQFPAHYDGVPVEVVDINGRHLAPAGGSPVQPGIGIFPVNLGAGDFGTLGAVVKTLPDFTSLFLTCDHVVPDVGQTVKSTSPGNPDLGTVPAKKNGQRSTLVDCALITPKNGLAFSEDIPGFPAPFGIGEITDDDAMNQTAVFKFGAKTGLTKGTVHQHDASVNIGGFLMVNQIAVMGNNGPLSFSQGGDSGSVLLRKKSDSTVEIVGLIFAENPQTGMSMASHFLTVADVLKITV
jgi:hypothetical protein